MPESQLLDGDQLKIGKQIVLPLGKAIEIAAKSMKTRFWRSVITMGGIVLAIAFLANILAVNSAVEGLKARVDTLRGDRRLDEAAALEELLRKNGYAAGEDELAGASKGVAGSAADDEQAKRDAKEIWLVTLAIFVALVGIMNSMLMSVTERFREIGTMKCLGALDSFIVKLFLLESSFQGALGTLVGIIGGLIVTAMQMSIAYGLGNFFGSLSLGLLWGVCWAFGVGCTVSVVGAIWPAVMAAKMEPVEAMRVDA